MPDLAPFQEPCPEHELFGGSIICSFPSRFLDVSSIREVPDNQEVYADPNRDESIILELLEYKHDISDNQSALWFLQDLANEQDSAQQLMVEAMNTALASDVPFLDPSTKIFTAVGQMAVSKGRQRVEARNIVRVYLANIRLPVVYTDILVTLYEPLYISELSETAAVVGSGPTAPAPITGCIPMADIFRLVLATFKIRDWNLFGG